MAAILRDMAMMAAALMALLASACAGRAASSAEAAGAETAAPQAEYPTFSGDSALRFVEQQMAFGARVPGSAAHDECARWLTAELKRLGVDTVTTQCVPVKAFTGETFTANNIMGRFDPSNPDRILLLAHWDTRPWADSETDQALRSKPVPGANDGASGVAVLLELARLMGQSKPAVGVDLLLVDMEDMGESDPWRNTEDTWCLGTQKWLEQMPYDATNRPRFAILLDMVGGTDAVFHRETISDHFAASVVNKVWAKAAQLGLGQRFPNKRGGSVVDDHLYVNRAGIPCVDIIENMNPATGSFNPTWHTLSDDLSGISAETLDAVGRVVVATIWDEKSSITKQ